MKRGGQQRLAKLDAVETYARRELVDALQKAQRNVAAEIARAARDRRIVTSERRRLKSFSAIGGYYDRLDRELTALIKDASYTGAKLFHDEAIADLRAARGRVDKAVVLFDRKRVDQVWSVVAPENGENLAAVFTDKMNAMQKTNLRQALIDTWRQAELEGQTLAERHKAAKEKWDALAGDTLASRFVDRSGRPWDNDNYLNMLTRTTVARVSRDTYFDTLTAAGYDLAVIENVDGDACDTCVEWDGKIISITGTSRDYPSYQDAMTDGWGHPNCRCSAEYIDETELPKPEGG